MLWKSIRRGTAGGGDRVGMTEGDASRARVLGYARTRVSAGFCRILSNSADGELGHCRLGIDDCGLMIADWGLQDVLLGLWFGWSGHGPRIVRGFCFVKCDAGGDSRLRRPLHNLLPGYGNGTRSTQNERGHHGQSISKQPLRLVIQRSPYAGMTWAGVGMTAGLDSRLRGSDGGGWVLGVLS